MPGARNIPGRKKRKVLVSTTPTTPTVPLTLLEAVNLMLAAVGTARITTLNAGQTNEEVQKAVNTINDVSIQTLSRGWYFNTDDAYPLTPSLTDGTITIPANVLSIDRVSSFRRSPPPNSQGLAESMTRYFTERGNSNGPGGSTLRQLYDLQNSTFSWVANTDGIDVERPLINGVLYCRIVWALTFEQCPQPARWLITCQAGNLFAAGRLPDRNVFQFTSATLADAERDMQVSDEENRDAFPEENPHYGMWRRR